MADTKISDLTAASALGGTEVIPGVQGGTNVKITPAQIKTYSTVVPRSYLAGCGIANNGTTPLTKIDVAAGQCTDSSNAVVMTSAGYTIDCSTSGAALGMDTGSLPATGTAHVYVIAKTDGTTRALCSTSLTPSLPSGYSYYRRVGSVRTNGSSQVLAFTQIDDHFYLAASILDAAAGYGTTRTLVALTVPGGIKTRPLMRISAYSGTGHTMVVGPDEPDETVSSSTTYSTAGGLSYSGNGPFSQSAVSYTNTSSQVAVRAGAASTGIAIRTCGWVDTRGRMA